MFYLYQGLYDFIQSRPGIREFHSTILRFIVLIHSTFFRERQSLRVYMCYTATALQGKFVSIPPFFVLESTVDTGRKDWLYLCVRDER